MLQFEEDDKAIVYSYTEIQLVKCKIFPLLSKWNPLVRGLLFRI